MTSAEIFAFTAALALAKATVYLQKKKRNDPFGKKTGVQRKATKTKFQSYMTIVYIYIEIYRDIDTHMYHHVSTEQKKQGKTAKKHREKKKL